MKFYDIGQFRSRCEVCKEVISTNENGFEIKDYTSKYSLKCFIAPISTTEYFGADRNNSSIKTTVVTRKKNDVTTRDSLLINGERFNIVNITREYNSQYMELLIEKVV